MPPLKKGDVRQALDKRIEAARRAQRRVEDGAVYDDPNKLHVEKGRERALQSVRKELFGERLPEAKH